MNGLARDHGQPPRQWREHWFEHDRVLSLNSFDDQAAVYFDESVRGQTGWILPFVSRAWRYVKSTYGNDFGPDERLYAVFHQGHYSGGHPATHFDASHDHRNTIDCGPGPWTAGREGMHDMPAHEIAHVVEFANNGVKGSPAFPVWGDSKWAEFFIYDLYVALGMQRDAARVRTMFLRGNDSFPRGGTHWFRDWFGPLWDEARGPDVLVEYFRLLAEQFPRSTGRRAYSRNMTMGEHVHFTSGATGRDLTYQAEIAFGRRDSWLQELAAARRAFPDITYRRRGSYDDVGPVAPQVQRRPAEDAGARAAETTAGTAAGARPASTRAGEAKTPLVVPAAGRKFVPGSASRAVAGRPMRPARPSSALYNRIQLTSSEPPEVAPPPTDEVGGGGTTKDA